MGTPAADVGHDSCASAPQATAVVGRSTSWCLNPVTDSAEATLRCSPWNPSKPDNGFRGGFALVIVPTHASIDAGCTAGVRRVTITHVALVATVGNASRTSTKRPGSTA